MELKTTNLKRFGIKQFDPCFEKLENNKPLELGLKEY